MVKKALRFFLAVLMVVGSFVAISNVLKTGLTGAESSAKWVHYDRQKPDCEGPGNDCLDMSTKPIK